MRLKQDIWLIEMYWIFAQWICVFYVIVEFKVSANELCVIIRFVLNWKIQTSSHKDINEYIIVIQM